jgi:hypothetical protein
LKFLFVQIQGGFNIGGLREQHIYLFYRVLVCFLNNNDKSLPKNISVEIEIVYTKNVNEIRHVGTTTYNTNRNLYIV